MPGLLRPGDAQQQPEEECQLTIEDALAFLDLVKYKFIHQPQVYEDFMEIFEEFHRLTLDTPGVIARVSNLFASNPELIVGFSVFLPPGFESEVQNIVQNLIQQQLNQSAPPAALGPGVNPGAAQLPAEDPAVVDALSYISQVKYRFIAQPQVYNNFVHYITEYRNGK